jgi:hypothetical protein
VSHNRKSFNRNSACLHPCLLLMSIPEGYICRSSDIAIFEKAKMRRRLSLAQLCALGENREDSNPGPRSCSCRLAGSAYSRSSPRAADWTSGQSEPALLPCGVQ